MLDHKFFIKPGVQAADSGYKISHEVNQSFSKIFASADSRFKLLGIKARDKVEKEIKDRITELKKFQHEMYGLKDVFVPAIDY